MNQVIQSAAEATGNSWLVGVATSVFLVFFLGYAAWVFSSRSKAYLDEASMLPFDSDDEPELMRSVALGTAGVRSEQE